MLRISRSYRRYRSQRQQEEQELEKQIKEREQEEGTKDKIMEKYKGCNEKHFNKTVFLERLMLEDMVSSVRFVVSMLTTLRFLHR